METVRSIISLSDRSPRSTFLLIYSDHNVIFAERLNMFDATFVTERTMLHQIHRRFIANEENRGKSASFPPERFLRFLLPFEA